MQQRLRAGVTTGKAFWKEVQDDDLQGKAAEVAYHLLFSIIPLLIFLAALSSFASQQIGVADTMADIRAWLSGRLPPETRIAVIEPIEETLAASTGGFLSFGAITALWGGKNAIGAMIEALNTVFDVKESRPWWKRQAVAVGLTLLLGISSVVGSAALLLSSEAGADIAGRIGLGGFWSSTWRWVQFPLIAALMAVVLAVVYWQGPDTDKGFKRMLPGAATTVVLWGVAIVALSIYFARFAGYLGGAYGALGGVMAFVFFLYVMSLITLIGGEISAGMVRRSETEAATQTSASATSDDSSRTRSGSPQQGAAS